MTVLVTGGSGLVGSHVITALVARGVAVRALVRAGGGAVVRRLGAEPVIGDVTDAAAWRGAIRTAGAVVHAAALVTKRASLDEYVAVNVEGSRLAAEAARGAGARLIHVSSVAVYGRSPGAATGVDEDFPFQAIAAGDYYARTKRLAEEAVRLVAERNGLSVLALRPNVIYGERDRLFTPRLIGAVRLGVMPRVGPGTNVLSCVYAGNVAAAVIAALEAPVQGFRAYNVTTDGPPALTQRQFVEAFGAALGTRIRWIPVPRPLAALGMIGWTLAQRAVSPRRYAGLGPAAIRFLTAANPFVAERARRELGWSPPYEAREAVRRSVAWWRTGSAAAS